MVLAASVFAGYRLFYVGSPTNTKPVQKDEPAILYLTTMTHLEDNWAGAGKDEDYFNRVAAEVRYGMDLASEYDATLTFETGLPFAQGCTNFDDNVMAEVLERGHGIGVHPDLPPQKELPISVATTHIKERVDALKELVGSDEIIGCSGVGGMSDWYTASKAAGCNFLDGIVGFNYLTMPMSARPEGYTDEAIFNAFFHRAAPVGDERFYPFWINSSKDFIPDEDGNILLSSGETSSLAGYAEAANDTKNSSNCGDCPLTVEDVETFVTEITAFAESRDVTKISKFNIYFPANMFVSENEEVLRAFFKAAQKLQEKGILEWASQAEVYEAMEAVR